VIPNFWTVVYIYIYIIYIYVLYIFIFILYYPVHFGGLSLKDKDCVLYSYYPPQIPWKDQIKLINDVLFLETIKLY